ncbi:hypothetical protein KSX_09470 [Ktedonospora formicarum]|uniref:Helicase HerA central domain-containing protein n=2 Tax=Ktedonospora formicarum TaxID=2778364 RepID=A0A8J3HZH7_9CHLR|nr:hypothetical protein KSX_09470 [Ktedonospora formicarum]
MQYQKGATSFALQIIPPAQVEQDQEIMLEAAMQSLVLDKKHPVALELTGTPERRSFIVRATTQAALDHVEAILRSQYPQIDVRPLREHEDPFRFEAHETVSAIELVAGGDPFLPLRTWQGEKGRQDNLTIDPLLGLLSALSKLPEHTRAIAQIGLAPAETTWSRKGLRKAVERATEPDKRDAMLDMAMFRMNRTSAISTPIIIAGAIIVCLFVLLRQFIPDWLLSAIGGAITNHPMHLTPQQTFLMFVYFAGLVLAGVALFFILEFIRGIVKPQQTYDSNLVAQKVSRMAYHSRVRLFVIGPKSLDYVANTPQTHQSMAQYEGLPQDIQLAEVRREVLLRMIAAYRQFNQSNGAYFIPRHLSDGKARRLVSREQLWGHGWYQGIAHSKHLLTVDTVASLWHLPNASALPEIALVEHRRARTMLIPPDLAQQSAGLPIVGYSEHGGYRLPFGLAPQFFTQHTLISGKSGEGKSTFMEHVARRAMEAGGLILIDPHGDLCDHVLHLVPPHRMDDVVYIDLSDPEASVGINILDVTLGRARDKAISDLLKTLAHIWTMSWGPRMENAFEMSLRTLFEANKVLVAQDPQDGPGKQYTLLDVMPLLTNENFCHAILQQIEDDYLHRWWREYYEPMTLMQQRDVINPVLTKVAKFESVTARRIIGQGASTLDFTQMVSERKIILFKLAKGVVGNDIAAIVGATMLGLFQITLEEQGTKAEQDRVRYPIILDEFQVLAGMDYGALAELRKYGATFYLATQSLEYLQKLDPVLLPTVLANVKQLITFYMSARDSETLAKELGVEEEDLLNLDMHTCYVKLSAINKRQPTFSLHVIPLKSGDPTQAESVRTRSRVRYARPVSEVDTMLRDAMLRGIRMGPAPTPPANKKRKAPTPPRPAQASKSTRPTTPQVERVTEKPSGRVTEKPSERVTEKPSERVVETPSEQPVERVIEQPSEQSVERPSERVIERPSEKQEESIIYLPAASAQPTPQYEPPKEAPREQPASPVETPEEIIILRPATTPRYDAVPVYGSSSEDPVIVLPPAVTITEEVEDTPTPEEVEIPEDGEASAPRKRRNRGRRGSKRANKKKNDAQGEAANETESESANTLE